MGDDDRGFRHGGRAIAPPPFTPAGDGSRLKSPHRIWNDERPGISPAFFVALGISSNKKAAEDMPPAACPFSAIRQSRTPAYLPPFSASLTALAGAKLSLRDAAIFIVAPVAGLRPSRAGLF